MALLADLLGGLAVELGEGGLDGLARGVDGGFGVGLCGGETDDRHTDLVDTPAHVVGVDGDVGEIIIIKKKKTSITFGEELPSGAYTTLVTHGSNHKMVILLKQ